MTQAKAVEVLVPSQVVSATVISPMTIIERAVAEGRSVETITELMALQERWDARQAKKAFDAAMSAAKAEIPTIAKNREVDFTSQKGRTNYRHEDLAGIASIVDPILAKHGLSYRYRTTSAVNEPVTVTCIVSHRDGHSEENTLSAGRDDSGNKNSIQAVGSTITYLQRYALKAALGLAASNDDDGKGAGKGLAGVITDKQRAELQKLIDESGTDIEKFVGLLGVEALADVQAKDFEGVKLILAQKSAVAKMKAGGK